MLRLGLTGSIATGKSTVLDAFAQLGVPVFSSDDAVHGLYRGKAIAPIEAAFSGVVRNGQVDRQALSALVVAQPDRIKTLEGIVHPLVREMIAQFLAASEAKGAQLAVVDIPLLFESGHDYGLDAIAVTTVDPAIQRDRALARPGMSVEKLDIILARQMPQDDKRKRATYIFDTSGKIEATKKMVKALVDAITASNTGRS